MHPPLQNILVIDIETVPLVYQYQALDEDTKALWDQKSIQYIGKKPDVTPESVYDKAGIWAEFGKIVSIAYGAFVLQGDALKFKTSYLVGHNESELIQAFFGIWHAFDQKRQGKAVLAGHNIKEFDVPYILRRALINNLTIPKSLQLNLFKTWETPLVDTLHLWRFGDFKHYTSLKLLAHVLGVPSSKDDIDGSEVAKVYFEEKNMERIALYCEKDVFTTAQVLLRLFNMPMIAAENWAKHADR